MFKKWMKMWSHLVKMRIRDDMSRGYEKWKKLSERDAKFIKSLRVDGEKMTLQDGLRIAEERRRGSRSH